MLNSSVKHVVCYAIIAIVFQSLSVADVFTWVQPDGGSFTDTANWDPSTGIPMDVDDVVFDLSDSYTVLLTDPEHVVQNADIQGGEVRLNSAVAFSTSQFTTNGGIQINSDGEDTAGLIVTAAVDLTSQGGVTIGAGGRLSIASNSSLTVGGMSVVDEEGDLDLNANGHLTVLPEASMTINQRVFDWDGVVTANTKTTILAGATLNMHAGRIDGGNDVFEATIHVNGGTLDVDNTANRWTMRGELNFDGSSGEANLGGDTAELRNSSTLVHAGTARVTAPLEVNNAVVAIFDDATLILDEPAVFNDGSTLTLASTGSLVVHADTTIDSSNFDWDGESETGTATTIANGATLQVSTNQFDESGDTHNATINLNEATLIVDNLADQWTLGGTANVHADTTNAVFGGDQLRLTGTLNMTGGLGVTFNAPLVVDPSASFTGDGPVIATNALTLLDSSNVPVPLDAHSQIHIGASPGTSTVSDLTLRPTSSLNIEVQPSLVIDGATTSGSGNDLLDVTGAVSLDGVLSIDFMAEPDNLPELGEQFTVLSYGERLGQFAAVTGTVINTELALALLFTDTNGDAVDDVLKLRASIPGDLNLDNKVSVADLSTFALNFNTTPGFFVEDTKTNSWELGDFNTDGAITVADLSLLALNFGFELLPDGMIHAPTPLSLSAIASIAGIDLVSVPEPSVTVCLLTLLVAFPLTLRGKTAVMNQAGRSY